MDRNKLKLLALMLVIVLPVSLATFSFMKSQSAGVVSTSNKGELISPVLDVTELGMLDPEGRPLFQPFEETVAGVDPADYQPRPWLLVYLGDSHCDEVCVERLYFLRQLHRRLGAEARRVSRYYLNVGEGAAPLSETTLDYINTQQPDMVVANAEEGSLRENLRRTHGEDEDPVSEHYIYVVDPVGNVMLYFTPDNDAADILSDIDKLLDRSSLG